MFPLLLISILCNFFTFLFIFLVWNFHYFLLQHRNWIATNMVALPNLWLLITFALLSNYVEARGCQCHVKENDAATAIESFHTYVRWVICLIPNICKKNSQSFLPEVFSPVAVTGAAAYVTKLAWSGWKEPHRAAEIHISLTQNLETGTSTVSWTAMAHVLFPNGGRKNFPSVA